MDKAQALYAFWAQFGLDVYDESSVPTAENAPLFPYLTYTTVTDSFGNDVLLSASLWYRSTSWAEISKKAEEISAEIGRGGSVVPVDGGGLWIRRGSPFAQRMSEESDDMVRRIYLNISAEYFTAD